MAGDSKLIVVFMGLLRCGEGISVLEVVGSSLFISGSTYPDKMNQGLLSSFGEVLLSSCGGFSNLVLSKRLLCICSGVQLSSCDGWSSL